MIIIDLDENKIQPFFESSNYKDKLQAFNCGYDHVRKSIYFKNFRSLLLEDFGYDYDSYYDAFCIILHEIYLNSDSPSIQEPKVMNFINRFIQTEIKSSYRQKLLEIYNLNLNHLLNQICMRLTTHPYNKSNLFFTTRLDPNDNMVFCACVPIERIIAKECVDRNSDVFFKTLFMINQKDVISYISNKNPLNVNINNLPLIVEKNYDGRMFISKKDFNEKVYDLMPLSLVRYILINDKNYEIDESLFFNKLRELSEEEITKLYRIPNARPIAIKNFLMTNHFSRLYIYALLNLKQDAKLNNWNQETIQAIKNGIDLSVIRK